MIQHIMCNIITAVPIGEIKTSEREKNMKIPILSKIHWGSRSPITNPQKKERRINLKEELDLLAKGKKTLTVKSIDINVQSNKRSVPIRLKTN